MQRRKIAALLQNTSIGPCCHACTTGNSSCHCQCFSASLRAPLGPSKKRWSRGDNMWRKLLRKQPSVTTHELSWSETFGNHTKAVWCSNNTRANAVQQVQSILASEAKSPMCAWRTLCSYSSIIWITTTTYRDGSANAYVSWDFLYDATLVSMAQNFQSCVAYLCSIYENSTLLPKICPWRLNWVLLNLKIHLFDIYDNILLVKCHILHLRIQYPFPG